MSGEYCDDDITLGMDIEIDEEYSSDIEEFDNENEQIDDRGDGEAAAAAAAADAPRGYQHEPEPRRAEPRRFRRTGGFTFSLSYV